MLPASTRRDRSDMLEIDARVTRVIRLIATPNLHRCSFIFRAINSKLSLAVPAPTPYRIVHIQGEGMLPACVDSADIFEIAHIARPVYSDEHLLLEIRITTPGPKDTKVIDQLSDSITVRTAGPSPFVRRQYNGVVLSSRYLNRF